jgi:uncharacterized membrane protein YgcG
MKRQILLLAITAAALSSCTTAYKTGQTPDDVYFSPAKPQDEYVRVKDQQQEEEYRYDDNYYDDRYLRMKVQNRTRWDYLDDWYAYDRYSYRYNYYYGSYYNPYTSWNYYNNPYCRNNVIAYHPGTVSVAQNVPKPRTFNLASYTNTTYNNANSNIRMNSYKPGTIGRPVYNNRNSKSNGFSNTVKQIFTGGNNNSSNSNSSTPTRTYTPSSSSSSSSSGSSSGSSGSSSGSTRPTRGGN